VLNGFIGVADGYHTTAGRPMGSVGVDRRHAEVDGSVRTEHPSLKAGRVR
jgi:hypothetical protein